MECCSEVGNPEGNLLAFAAGRLRGGEAARMAGHVRKCQQCEQWVRDQQVVLDALDLFDTPPVSHGFNRALYARLEERTTLREVVTKWLDVVTLRPALPIGMAAAIVVMAALLIHFPLLRYEQFQFGNHVTAVETERVSPADADRLKQDLDDLQLLHQLDVVSDDSQAKKAGAL